MHNRTSAFVAVGVFAACAAHAGAGVVFGLGFGSLSGGYRWDAAPRSVNLGGTLYERSLNSALRYSLQGGSYEAYRNLFSWNTIPSVPQFTAAIDNAFNAWTGVDPATGLGTGVSFVPDLATPVVGTASGGGVNIRGAEIDLFGSKTATFWGMGNGGTQGETFFNTIGGTVTLTSGTPNYPGANPISGADITMNSNPEAVYDLDLFRRILTHEIGHSIGLGDVEGSINPNSFIDDNLNLASSMTALATLNNSWALMVNVLNPAASLGLARFTVPVADPGLTTVGVDILMESYGVGISSGNPIESLVPLTNDDYGTRQFLYPATVPAPGAVGPLLLTLGVARNRRRRV